MSEVEQYLKDMKFKRRTLGGVDEEDVLLHIKKICELYRAELGGKEAAARETEQTLRKLQDAQRELEEERRTSGGLREAADRARRELEEQRAANGELRDSMELLRQELDRQNQAVAELRQALDRARQEGPPRQGWAAQPPAAEPGPQAAQEPAPYQEMDRLRGEVLALRELAGLRREVDELRRRSRPQPPADWSPWLNQLDQTLDTLRALREQAQRAAPGEEGPYGP